MTSRFAVALAVASSLVLAGCGHVRPAPGSPGRARLTSLLTAVAVIDARVHTPGYDRDCASGRGCVFGPAWTDDTDAPGGHNGCDTRDDVLAGQLRGVSFSPGTHRCVVTAGTLLDPYTGKRVDFRKRDAGTVQIDHVYPLAAAWDMGAARWPLELRERFANDETYNLLAVAGAANQDKGDKTPADWLPPSAAGRCFYAGKYLSVAARYHLPVTAADHRVLAGIAATCDG
jgi:hypothetical protein